MTEDEPKHLYAVMDRIRFASRDNPITEINLRTGRGGSLKNSLTDIVDQEEDTDLPAIIGGTNASGKTSLLRGIREVCNLLQHSPITKEKSKKCRQLLRDMGISVLEMEFIVELASSKSRGFAGWAGSWVRKSGKGHRQDLVHIEANVYEEENKEVSWHEKFNYDVDLHPLFLENILSVKFDSKDDARGMTWCDGLRIRRAGQHTVLEKMYHSYGDLHDTTQKPAFFRKIKQDKVIEAFLESCKEKNIGGLQLSNFDLWTKKEERRWPILFQPATLIEVDRNQSGLLEKLGQLRTLIPSLSNQFKVWRDEPEILRTTLINMKEGNQLFTALGLKSSDIFYQKRDHPEWLFLHDYAPDIVESMMLKPDWINMYTWYGEFAWRSNQKQRGIDVIMEGCLHDIVRYVAGGSHLPRVLVGEKTGVESRYGATFDVEWMDWDEKKHSRIPKKRDKFLWGSPDDDRFLDHKEKPHTPISEILRELPFLAQLVGMEKEEADLLDVLVRFNAFTPTENINHPYLSSGQEQVLALILAVRGAKEGSLILIDEPEISLHVDWQEQLVEQLHAPLTGSRLFIATHSPDIAVHHRHLCTILKASDEEGFYRENK